MRIVLDTNCLLVVLPVSSLYRCLWNAFRQKKIYTNALTANTRFPYDATL